MVVQQLMVVQLYDGASTEEWPKRMVMMVER